MALRTCPECNGVVSDQAVACTHCGYPFACPECGGNIPDQPDSCPFCGYPFVLPDDEPLDAATDKFSTNQPLSHIVMGDEEASDDAVFTPSDLDSKTTPSEEEVDLESRKEADRKERWQKRRDTVLKRKRRRDIVKLFVARTKAFLAVGFIGAGIVANICIVKTKSFCSDRFVIIGIPILALIFVLFVAFCLIVDMILHPDMFF